jgi:hypothetical protein
MIGKDDTGCREWPIIVAQNQLFDHTGKEEQQTGFRKTCRIGRAIERNRRQLRSIDLCQNMNWRLGFMLSLPLDFGRQCWPSPFTMPAFER